MRSRAASHLVLSRSSSARSNSASARCGSISSARVAAAAAAGDRLRPGRAPARRAPAPTRDPARAPAGTTSPPPRGCIFRGTADPTPCRCAGFEPGCRGGAEEALASRARAKRCGGPRRRGRATPDRCPTARKSTLRSCVPRRRRGRALEQQRQLERGVAERSPVGCRLQHRDRVAVPTLVDGEMREHGDRRGIVRRPGVRERLRLGRLAVRDGAPGARRKRQRPSRAPADRATAR